MNLPVRVIDEKQAVSPDRILSATEFVYTAANVAAAGTRLSNSFEPLGRVQGPDHHDLPTTLRRSTLEPE
jgi:hypothetical protein